MRNANFHISPIFSPAFVSPSKWVPCRVHLNFDESVKATSLPVQCTQVTRPESQKQSTGITQLQPSSSGLHVSTVQYLSFSSHFIPATVPIFAQKIITKKNLFSFLINRFHRTRFYTSNHQKKILFFSSLINRSYLGFDRMTSPV